MSRRLLRRFMNFGGSLLCMGLLCGCHTSKGETVNLPQTTETETWEQETETKVEAIYVYVCGAVRRPGVYTLNAGARVYQAIDLAGGLTENAAGTYINLAETLMDGQQLYVPCFDDTGDVALPEGLGKSGQSDSRVNINTATSVELETLPGIGEGKAARIISYRENYGPFETVEDLTQVSGIGEATLDQLRDLIRVN